LKRTDPIDCAAGFSSLGVHIFFPPPSASIWCGPHGLLERSSRISLFRRQYDATRPSSAPELSRFLFDTLKQIGDAPPVFSVGLLLTKKLFLSRMHIIRPSGASGEFFRLLVRRGNLKSRQLFPHASGMFFRETPPVPSQLPPGLIARRGTEYRSFAYGLQSTFLGSEVFFTFALFPVGIVWCFFGAVRSSSSHISPFGEDGGVIVARDHDYLTFLSVLPLLEFCDMFCRFLASGAEC